MKLCTFVKSNISAYIDGCLGENDRIKLENHLEECKKCREEYESILLISNALNLNEIEVPDGYMQTLKARIARDCVSQKQKHGIFTYVNYKTCSALFAVVLLAVSFKTPLYDNILKLQSERYAVTDTADVKNNEADLVTSENKNDKKIAEIALDDNKAESALEEQIYHNTANKTANKTANNESQLNMQSESNAKTENNQAEKNVENEKENLKTSRNIEESDNVSAITEDTNESSLDTYEIAVGNLRSKDETSYTGGTEGNSGGASIAMASYMQENISKIIVVKNAEVTKIISEYNAVIDENTAHITLSLDEYKAFKEKIKDFMIDINEVAYENSNVNVEIFFK